ncbi:MAG: GNAT family N-acetyltransferase [Chloroflexi bacterium]|nr:GNAT family N-acetyltransferase [Chloroflexota bacterium]
MVSSVTPLTVVPYERRYRAEVLDLISYSYQRHVHLDWYDADEWLDHIGGIVQLAWRGTHLVGMLGASYPTDGMAWLRLAALADGVHEQEVMDRLWVPLVDAMVVAGVRQCWVLALEPWLDYALAPLGLRQVEMLVTLRREGAALPPVDSHGVTLHTATIDDVEEMTAIDQAAFAPPYPMSAHDMRRAYRTSAISTVARLDGRMVGFQISTRHGDQGHLARLAVLPELQGHGIGVLLTRECVAAFLRRQVDAVSVNTQASNTRSLKTYQALGFARTGYDLPIYAATFA